MHGYMTDPMVKTLRPHIEGEVVHDLGAGSGELSRLLVELGAAHVVAIDKDWRGGPRTPPKTEVHECYFEHYTGVQPKVAFISWPVNRVIPGLLDLIAGASKVIYLGCCTGGSDCGWSGLYDHLLYRELLASVDHYKNSLMIYGATTPTRHAPRTVEEFAWVTTDDTWFSFERAEELFRSAANKGGS